MIKVFSKIKIIEQMEHSECGLACVTMICNYYSAGIELSELRDIYGVPNGGFTFFQLNEILSDQCIDSRGVNIKDINLVSQNSLPFIAFWKNNHFIVVEKIKKHKVLICDPASTKRWIKRCEFDENFSGKAILCEPNDRFMCKKGINKFKYFFNLFSKKKYLTIIVILISLVIQGLGLFIPIITRYLTDKVYSIAHIDLNDIGIILIIYFLLYYFLNMYRTMLIIKLQNIFDREVMSSLLNHILVLPYKFFINRSTGELIFRLNSNIYVKQILTQKLVTLILDIILSIAYIYLMIKFSFTLSMIIFIVTLIIALISIINTYKINKVIDFEMIHQTKVQKILSEIVNNMTTIKTLGQEKLFFSKWNDYFSDKIKYSTKKEYLNSLFSNFSHTIQFILPLFILWLGSYNINNTFTIGTLVAFNAIAMAFLQPIISISGSYSELILLNTYLDKWYDILNTKKEAYKQENLDIQDGSICIENLNFKYNKLSKNILNNINMNINKHDKVAIVGKSGSGKSTLLKILMGLHLEYDGEIYVDNINMDNININNYRKQIGIVLQESQLFNSSIKENIIFKNENIKEDFLSEIIDKVGLREVIDDLALGLDTIISENGVNLSGGQRQKISLARAMINNPNILLLDEPTSSLDNIAEREFMDKIFNLETTCIVVAHRLSTIDKFNKIYVMDNGSIIEEGTHDELLKKRGHYYNLYLEDNILNRI